MPLGHGDLVDGDGAEVLELGLGIAPRQVALLDVLDHVPADIEVMGDVLDGHAPRQLQDVALEGLGVAAARVGEGDLDLADPPAGATFDARDREGHGVLRLPMGRARKRRSAWPREMTSREPQAEQRQSGDPARW